ncbi:BlaI/MecI/CopY family transcriptional regulator [Streptomyces sp. NPDC048111]|uniref:BlaI/MecI/CopY family transcriptional regulator n=1 Tax=Streptomyces sp. NPDC048111 TaxID=3365500 RepID=UPI00370FBB63
MSSQSAAKLRSRYVEQVASELEENRRRQGELAKEAEQLKQEEELLSDILRLAERYEGFADASRLPVQTQDEPASPAPGRRAPAASSVGPSTSSARRSAARQPLLQDVLLDLLTPHEEPTTAKELRDELVAKHPARTPTPQVVRNTLESLVAKGHVRRHKRGRAVSYDVIRGTRAS